MHRRRGLRLAATATAVAALMCGPGTPLTGTALATPAPAAAPQVAPTPAPATTPGAPTGIPAPLPPLTLDPTHAVGGPLLATRGVVVRPKPGVAAPQLPNVPGAGWAVADLTTGEVLAARDPHGRYLPASTLKTLTAITLLPLLEPTRTYTPVAQDVEQDGTKIGMVAGKPYLIRDLFSVMLMLSDNAAASALANAAGGWVATLGLMNDEARRLGAWDTHAENPSGLDAVGQVTSAYDMLLLARAALAIPEFRRIAGTRNATFPGPKNEPWTYGNKNMLLRVYPGATGVKPGFTSIAHGTLIGSAKRNGHEIAVGVLGALPNAYVAAMPLLDWGFAATGKVEPVGRLVDVGEVTGSPADAAAAAAAPAEETSGGSGGADGDIPSAAGSNARTGAAVPDAAGAVVASVLAVGVVGVLALIRRRQRRGGRKPIRS